MNHLITAILLLLGRKPPLPKGESKRFLDDFVHAFSEFRKKKQEDYVWTVCERLDKDHEMKRAAVALRIGFKTRAGLDTFKKKGYLSGDKLALLELLLGRWLSKPTPDPLDNHRVFLDAMHLVIKQQRQDIVFQRVEFEVLRRFFKKEWLEKLTAASDQERDGYYRLLLKQAHIEAKIDPNKPVLKKRVSVTEVGR